MKSKKINIKGIKALLDEMNFHSRAVLACLAGIMCQLVCEIKNWDITLNDVLKELQSEFEFSVYLGLLIFSGDHYLHHRFLINTGYSAEEETVYTIFDKNLAGTLFTDEIL